MNWKRALPGLVFAGLAYGLYAVNAPPLPKRPHKSAAVHQGAGAAALIKPMVVTVPKTNVIVWQYPATINPSNYWWDIQTSTNLQTWSVLVTNASGEIVVTVKKTVPLQVYRLSAKLSP